MSQNTTPSANSHKDTIAVPENPSRDELQESLKQAEFPQAAHMAKEIFGVNPERSQEEE